MIKSELSVINFCGHPFYFRDGTSDSFLLQNNLLSAPEKREYLLPMEMKPKIVFDIGANIGAVSLLLEHTYQDATIYAFEPDPENFSILEQNVKPYPRIIPLNYGLSDFNGEVDLYDSADEVNFGGLSMFQGVGNSEKRTTINVRNVAEIINELDIKNLDLIKIDCEGAEFSILKALEPFMANTMWIEGELHGVNDFELLNLLSKKFKLAFNKKFGDRNWNFKAVNKDFQF